MDFNKSIEPKFEQNILYWLGSEPECSDSNEEYTESFVEIDRDIRNIGGSPDLLIDLEKKRTKLCKSCNSNQDFVVINYDPSFH